MALKLLIYFPKQVLAIYTYTRPCNVDDGEVAPSGKEFCAAFLIDFWSFNLVPEPNAKSPNPNKNNAESKSFFTFRYANG